MRKCWPSRRASKAEGHESAWNRFVHQELQGYSPIITGNRVLAFFLVATIILIPLGAAILAASLSVTEYKVRYDNVGQGLNTTDKAAQQRALWASEDVGIPSTVQITTTTTMKAPVSSLLGQPSPPNYKPSSSFSIMPLCCRCSCIMSCRVTTKITKGKPPSILRVPWCASSVCAATPKAWNRLTAAVMCSRHSQRKRSLDGTTDPCSFCSALQIRSEFGICPIRRPEQSSGHFGTMRSTAMGQQHRKLKC